MKETKHKNKILKTEENKKEQSKQRTKWQKKEAVVMEDTDKGAWAGSALFSFLPQRWRLPHALDHRRFVEYLAVELFRGDGNASQPPSVHLSRRSSPDFFVLKNKETKKQNKKQQDKKGETKERESKGWRDRDEGNDTK